MAASGSPPPREGLLEVIEELGTDALVDASLGETGESQYARVCVYDHVCVHDCT